MREISIVSPVDLCMRCMSVLLTSSLVVTAIVRNLVIFRLNAGSTESECLFASNFSEARAIAYIMESLY